MIHYHISYHKKKYHCICGMDKYGQVTTGSLSKNLHRHLPPCCPTAVGYWKWILANSLSSTSVRILRLPVSGSLGQPFCKLCDPVRCDSAIRSPASKTENGNATPLQYGTTSISNMTWPWAVHHNCESCVCVILIIDYDYWYSDLNLIWLVELEPFEWLQSSVFSPSCTAHIRRKFPSIDSKPAT